MTDVIVCYPRGVLYRRVQDCPTCDRRRRFVCRWEAWYGVSVTCLGCGDSWCDGERYERPFLRGWRQAAIRRAKQRWTNALPYREAQAAIRAELAEELAGFQDTA